MKPLLNLQDLKELYRKGMIHAKKNYKNYFGNDLEKACHLQEQAIINSKTENDFMNAIWFPNPIFQNAFNHSNSVCTGCELNLTPIQFGVGHIGWYFTYGVAGKYCFNINFMRLEIAPPDVINFDRSEAVRWYVGGGYGIVDGEWYIIKPEWIYMKYIQPDTSTFSLQGEGQYIKASLTSPFPMRFNISLSFTDMKSVSHSIEIDFNARARPVANFPKSNINSLGNYSMYYSYTDCEIIFKTNSEIEKGDGWIDHQLMGNSVPKNIYDQATKAVLNTLSRSGQTGWLWFALQDYESNIQYMFAYFYPKGYYQVTNLVKKKEHMFPQLINVYKNGVPHFNPTSTTMDYKETKVYMIETINIDGYELPTKYNITLPGGKEVILAVASKEPNLYPIPSSPYECPAILYNKHGNRIGIGLIEANLFRDDHNFAKRALSYANINPDSNTIEMFLQGARPPQTTWQNIKAYTVVLLPLWIIIAVFIYVLYRKDKRSTRFAFSITLIAILYLIYKAI